MKLTRFLRNNLAWTLNKNIFGNLCCAPTAEKQLFDQMYKLSDRYFPQRKSVQTIFTEFALNEIALFVPQTTAQKCIKQQFETYWKCFLRLKNLFAKQYMVFPADDITRLELVAQLIARCTQFAVDSRTLADICTKACDVFDFEEREAANLQNVVELYKINFFCAVAKGTMKKQKCAETRLAKMLPAALNTEFLFNSQLRHCGYATETLAANVDCFGNSATKFLAPTKIDVRHYFYCNGKNVFDTFCYSKFGQNTAEFASDTATFKTHMQYFLHNSCEVRKYTVANTGKGNKKLTTDFLFRHANSGKRTYFNVDGALCLSVEGEEEFYCAIAIVLDNKILPCQFEEGRISAQFSLPAATAIRFDLVTVYAENMPQLANLLAALNNYGETRCPYQTDAPSQNVICLPHKLHPTAHGYIGRAEILQKATVLNFSYQLGNDNIATFLDNLGNCTTLMKGFAFGVGGEKVYSVRNGTIRQLNCGKFALDKDSIVYKKDGNCCTVMHNADKIFTVQHDALQKTLFYFPLEEHSLVKFCDNVFTVTSALRKFSVQCVGKVQCYTTNALDCNPERLRYKFASETDCGNCLAICFDSALFVQLKIHSLGETSLPNPLVRESLVSTYLNYVNSKNVFCLNNFLKRASALTLAAITFTNPQFVKNFVQNNLGKDSFYYDAAGNKKQFFDKLAIPLAVVYYANLANDKNFPTDQLKKHISSIVFKETYTGTDLCIKALILKKATHIAGFDKVRCLIEYNNIKKIICADSKLYGFAQAIGAVPMCNPSKERLKDLCNSCGIEKSWYYVSQLENLYGLSLVEGTLHFAPKVTQENVLEQLALCVSGKRIDTSFAKSTVQCMTLNGTQYFAPFKTQSLKNQENTLVVRY